MKLRGWFFALAVAACSKSPQAVPRPLPAAQGSGPVAAKPAAHYEVPTLRLPRDVLPDLNRVRLVLDPGKDTFVGHIDIDATVAAPTDLFWLNATDITVNKASVTVGTETWSLDVLPQRKDFVGFRAPASIPAGTVTIAIDYEGKIADVETHGIFRQREGEHWYAFTQFEPTDARRAFPCFDEPDSKVPWQITLEVPNDVIALSNAPVASEGKGAPGNRVVAFQKTKPLPSYLVAFAVGPFDIVAAGTSRTGVPIRVAVSRGRGGDVDYVVETTGPLLALLEDYFAAPYPYEKLDIVGVPLTVGFGAMENPGLITYRQSLLVARPVDRSIDYERSYAAITAHELAHQWFGNLVTMSFWNDIWLNEAFASWLGPKIVHRFKPAWHGDVSLVKRRSGALASDSLQNARAIRQPIASENDIHNAFDNITYAKGASVIQMFEAWLGESTLREGVRRYVKKHAWKNAGAEALLDGLGEVAQKDVRTPFLRLLRQVGAPLITFGLVCQKGRAPTVTMTQERYLPLGSQASADQRWQIPVCVSYPAAQKRGRDCALLDEKTAELELSETKVCPAWVLPNDGMAGYYRSAFAGDLLARLLDRGLKNLSAPERVGVVGDVNALVHAGKADYGVSLGLAARMAKDKNRVIAEQAAGIIAGIDDIVPEKLRPNYARFIRQTFAARARKLGWIGQAGEDEDTRLLRATLLRLVTDQGEDRTLSAQARKLALAWLDDHRTVDANMVDVVLDTAALTGDADLWERFYEGAKNGQDRTDRQRLLDALGRFQNRELLMKSISLVLSSELDIRESAGALFVAMNDAGTRKIAYDYVRKNYDAISEKLPKEPQARLIYGGTNQCDPALREEIEAFFKPKAQLLPGGPRIYAQAMEHLDLCIIQRQTQTPSVAAFLATY